MLLESGSRESEVTYTTPVGRLIHLYRAIVIQAVHDFGYSSTEEDWEKFLSGENFETLCLFSEFEPGWVLKIFNSISKVPVETRREITTEVVHLMKKMPLPEGVLE